MVWNQPPFKVNYVNVRSISESAGIYRKNTFSGLEKMKKKTKTVTNSSCFFYSRNACNTYRMLNCVRLPKVNESIHFFVRQANKARGELDGFIRAQNAFSNPPGLIKDMWPFISDTYNILKRISVEGVIINQL